MDLLECISPSQSTTWFLMRKALYLFIITMLCGLFIICITLYFVWGKDLSQHFNQEIPHHFLIIFKHNFKVYLLFCIPIWGIIHFAIAFMITFSSIGLAIVHLSFFQTIINFKHLPLELFALCIPVVTMNFKQSFKIKNLSLGVILLFMASIIEFYG